MGDRVPNRAKVIDKIQVFFLKIFFQDISSKAAFTRKHKEIHQKEYMEENELVNMLKEKKHKIIEILLKERKRCKDLRKGNKELHREIIKKKVKYFFFEDFLERG